MSYNSNDDKKSYNHEINSQKGSSQLSDSNKNDTNIFTKKCKICNADNSSLDSENKFFEDKNNVPVTKPLKSNLKSEIHVNQDNESNQSTEAKNQNSELLDGSNKKFNQKIIKKSSNENNNIQQNQNKGIKGKTNNANESENVIRTIDSERPPSGYSSYSYYYDYSDSENDEDIYGYGYQDNKKNRKRKKNKKIYPKYVPPVIDVPPDELSILKKKALNLEPLEDLKDDVYEVLILSLAEDRKNCARSENLEQSELLNHAINHVTECQLEQRKYVLQQEAYAKYKDQMEIVQSELQIFDEETAKLEAELRAKINFQRCTLQEQHERQIQILQTQWNSDEKKKQYNHASPRLLFLRKQYHQLMQQCRFKEATGVKTQIAQIEIKEGNEAIQAMQHNFDENMNQILKKQNEELQFYDARSKIQLKKLKQEREKLRIPIENKESKLKNMEVKINDPDKLWNCAQMKRTTEISQGKIRDAKVSPKLSAKDLGQKEETTIKLPKLKLRKKMPKSAF